MAEFNVADARAARLGKGGPHSLTLDNGTYEAPPEAPWVFVEHVARGRVPAALEAALGEDGWADLKSGSKEDINAVLGFLLEAWGMRDPDADDDGDVDTGE